MARVNIATVKTPPAADVDRCSQWLPQSWRDGLCPIAGTSHIARRLPLCIPLAIHRRPAAV